MNGFWLLADWAICPNLVKMDLDQLGIVVLDQSQDPSTAQFLTLNIGSNFTSTN